MTPYKTVSPIVDKNGNPKKKGGSAPDWFLSEHIDVFEQEDYAKAGVTVERPKWGSLFSEPRTGNDVLFYVTGRDYFKDVAAAIEGASKSIFIIGWQVNFDVELVSGKTLLQYLYEAVRKPNGPCVYVMPWMSPGVGVNTHDFETMLAVFHLNWGLGSNRRAFAMPATQQCDLGSLGLMFSHHQKLVVIDNTTAFVGGIDLAYGRRDDGRYLLSADGRKGNELYNSCVPPVGNVTKTQMSDHYMTMLEMVMGCSDSKMRTFGAWATSPTFRPIARALDAKKAASDGVSSAIKPIAEPLAEWWKNTDLTPRFVRHLQDMAVDTAQASVTNAYGTAQSVCESIKWGYEQMPAGVQQKLQGLVDWGSGIAQDPNAATVGWLNGASVDNLPSDQALPVSEKIRSLTMESMVSLPESAAQRKTPYENLLVKWKRMAPIGGTYVDPDLQPRMPWHDVHSRIQGPSVYDLSMNFIKRWDGTAKAYETLRKQAGTASRPNEFPRIKAEHIPKSSAAPPSPKCTVQVLRSAPLGLLKDEHKAGTKKDPVPTLKQNNCLKAMMRAVRNSKQFLYIEGQFFQSDFGIEGPNRGKQSGPVGALLDIKRSPHYRKFAKELEIDGVPPDQILTKMRYAKLDDVMRDPDWPSFKKDLGDVLKNTATIKGMNALGQPQKHLLNPIGQTIVCRIRKAILHDNLPYHVYMVLPVHPEGTLNTLNIISQVHLTQHSLSLGHNSLINGIRQALLERRLFNARTPKPATKAQIDQARKEIQAEVRILNLEDLAKAIGEEWREYLTLLNLRNWETLGTGKKTRTVTEQIYVHSKLLIADDQVAILGSANINDRSQLGDRDSELAVIIHDSDQKAVALDGKKPSFVSVCVHDLRKRLWSKIFGLTDGAARPASSLGGVVDKPMAPETWKAIRQVAIKNAEAYDRAFLFTPRNQAPPVIEKTTEKDKEPPASLWPVWKYSEFGNHNAGGKLVYRMPFEYAFWRKPEDKGDPNTWEASACAPEVPPKNAQGFIVDLPVNWTRYEQNNTGFNVVIIASNDLPGFPGVSIQAQERRLVAQTPSQPVEVDA